MLFESPVLTEQISVVAGVDHQRAVGLAGFFEGRQHVAHVAIEEGNRRVVCGGDALFFSRRQTAEDSGDLPFLLVLNSRGLELLGIEPAAVLDWKIKRRMRLVETDEQKKRLVPPLVQKSVRMLSKISRGRVVVERGHRQSGRIQPDARRILEGM